MYELPEALRGELKKPFGPVTSGSFVDELGEGPVATVGDVVTAKALEDGRTPDVMVVDGHTKRTEDAPTFEAPDTVQRVHVENPAGRITQALWDAVEDAFEASSPTLLEVEGEEDLATLPAIVHAPDGAHVVYGQPDEGAVVVTVDQIARERVDNLLARMEVV